ARPPRVTRDHRGAGARVPRPALTIPIAVPSLPGLQLAPNRGAPEMNDVFRSTTIVAVRRAGSAAMAGDGQVSLGQTVMKSHARKVRRIAEGTVLAGFAGASADAFTLLERFEAKLREHSGSLPRAAVELAKDWRTDRFLRRREAMLVVMDAQA